MKKLLSVIIIVTLIAAALVFPASAEEIGEADTSLGKTLIVPQVRVVTENGNGLELQKADGYVNASVTITDVDGTELSDSA